MCSLTAYIEAALELAHYDKLEDGTFAGEIPRLAGIDLNQRASGRLASRQKA